MTTKLTALALAFAISGCALDGGDDAVTTSPLARTPDAITLTGDNYFPESITASLLGTLYVASITTGEIVRIPAWTRTPEPFVAAGVNVGTAGVAFDDLRQVLWACAVDLTFATPTALRAFSAVDGSLLASYEIPNGGVCGDIALARGDVYLTDTLLGLIYQLHTPSLLRATDGTLALWADDPAFRGAGFLQINGIAFDGLRTFYTTNYSTGALVRVRIRSNGTAAPAEPITTPRALQFPDGIRITRPFASSLFVTENTGALSRVDIAGDAATIAPLATFDEPTSVVRTGNDLWVTDGQVLRLQGVEPSPLNLPFTIRRFRL